MASIQLTERPGLVLVAAIVLHVILISSQVNARSGIPMLHVATFGVFAEVQRATMNVIGGVRGIWTGYIDLRTVRKDNESLKQNLQMMQVQLQEARALAQRSESLRQLLELRERAGVETTATDVIGGPADPDFRTMTIDKGTSDGLKADMAVISPAGVVGRVIRPTPRASMVQLLIDRNAAAGAMIERTRAQGIVVGQGTDTLQMEYVPATADVKPGDLVITSGIDKIYPKGFVIGTVEHVDRGPGSFRAITIKPSVDFSRLEELLVVLTPPAAQVEEQPLPAASAPGAPGNTTPGGPRE
jgi:rod shape-determining protein MreC